MPSAVAVTITLVTTSAMVIHSAVETLCSGTVMTSPGCTLPAALTAIRETCPDVPEVRELLEFMACSKRGVHPSVHFARVADREPDAAPDV